MDDKRSSIEEVLATERRWVQAHRDLDLETIEDILAEDYRQIRADGSVIGKAEALASYTSMTRSWDLAESDEYEIEIYGDVAVLIGRWRGRGKNRGERFDYSARFTAIYVRTSGSWKLVVEQSTPISKKG